MVSRTLVVSIILTSILAIVFIFVLMPKESSKIEGYPIAEPPSSSSSPASEVKIDDPTLTPFQQSALERIDGSTMEKISELMQRRDLSSAEKQKRSKELMDERNRRIKEILDN